jgi:hypothetical protein
MGDAADEKTFTKEDLGFTMTTSINVVLNSSVWKPR